MTNEHEEVRSQLSEEFRADAEELETLAEVGRLRRQTLAAALGDAMARGDEVTVSCGTLSLSGKLTTAIRDLAIVETDTSEASIFLGGPVGFSTRRRAVGGHSGATPVRTFLAKLRELELSGEPLQMFGGFGSVSGTIAIVAEDHVRIEREDETWLLALTEIGIVLRPTPPSLDLR